MSRSVNRESSSCKGACTSEVSSVSRLSGNEKKSNEVVSNRKKESWDRIKEAICSLNTKERTKNFIMKILMYPMTENTSPLP